MRREIVAGFVARRHPRHDRVSLRIALWSAFADVYGPHWLLVALTVGTALVGVVMWGTLVGSLLPFILRRLGFDPAASSAPFVATLVDVTGLVIYFSVAPADPARHPALTLCPRPLRAESRRAGCGPAARRPRTAALLTCYSSNMYVISIT